jgi:hypothetical protein
MPTSAEVVLAAWTPPPTIIGFSGTALETESAVQLDWTVSTLSDTDFNNYRIYRRESGAELWVPLADINTKSTVQFRDEYAGQTIQYEYAITQYKVVVGDVPLESDFSEIVTIALESDAWFVKPNGMLALELFVVEEEHSSVVQQEVFEPLASVRKRVVRGNVLGNEGSITSQFDNAVARATKVYFEELKAIKGPHIVKSAFGDVWIVELDAPGYKYLAGGHLEVTFGWVEI